MSHANSAMPPETLRQQVAKYRERHPDYVLYAAALKRVLGKACRGAFPEAIVQTRAKSVSSFAEKCVRKYAKYNDPINQFSDFCGGRIIVQTLDQVSAVRRFMEDNFEILEADEKSLKLGDDKFGYRDMHYVVRIIPEKAVTLGFLPDEVRAIGDKRAEIQVRTWVQHAWADTLHDRMYKAKLNLPAEFKRTGALLAAIMEDGDRAFNRLAGDIDGMLANFNAYAPREEVERELGIQGLILSGADEARKPEISLHIAQMETARGGSDVVVERLTPYADMSGMLGYAIRIELGYALCRRSRGQPGSDLYRKGQDYLEHAVEQLRVQSCGEVMDPGRCAGLRACALARLAGTYGPQKAAHLARKCYREALELEPGNPYYLADVVGHEIHCLHRRDFIGVMATTLRQAIRTCREHMLNGTEMPYAAFTAGRLHLLLDESDSAIACYARGIRHVLAGTTGAPEDVFESEKHWLWLVTDPEPLSGEYLWAAELLDLAGRIQKEGKESPNVTDASTRGAVLIVAGGADSLDPEQANQLRPMLVEALAGYSGTVYSGGTRSGVPGCVGYAAERVGQIGKRSFRLMGYLPRLRPGTVVEDVRYDERIECGEDGFSAEQMLRNWKDVLDSGRSPGEVRVLGFGGGPLSALEYRIALALGATVGLVEKSGGTAEVLARDPFWDGDRLLLRLPNDPATLRAFVHASRSNAIIEQEGIEKMAMALHDKYVKLSASRLPENMKPWNKLADTFKTANLEQAGYAVQILDAGGFAVRKATGSCSAIDFMPEEIERMAEWEHGRWNMERLLNGWRRGPVRDDKRKVHDCIVPWDELPPAIKEYDRNAVRAFPSLLAGVGLDVVRKGQ